VDTKLLVTNNTSSFREQKFNPEEEANVIIRNVARLSPYKQHKQITAIWRMFIIYIKWFADMNWVWHYYIIEREAFRLDLRIFVYSIKDQNILRRSARSVK
jgi:hypothetical protein